MSEWIRHRGSKSMPKCLEGKLFEVRHRDGVIAEYDGKGSWYWDRRGNDWDIFAFRILGDIEQPKTAIELQAEEVGIPEPVRLVDADGWIEWKGGECPVPDDAAVEYRLRDGWNDLRDRADSLRWAHIGVTSDITAYRLRQSQEWPEDRMDIVGQNGNDGLHYDDTHLGIKRPDGDGWVKYNAGDVVDLDVVVSIDWVNVSGNANTANSPRDLMWNNGSATHQIAWYRLNYGDKEGIVHMPTTAPDFLQSAINTLTQRGNDYDKPEGERSASAVAVAFNAITGKDLTDAEVYLVLQLVKDVRQWQSADYHADSALDCVAYAALKAEALAASSK